MKVRRGTSGEEGRVVREERAPRDRADPDAHLDPTIALTLVTKSRLGDEHDGARRSLHDRVEAETPPRPVFPWRPRRQKCARDVTALTEA